MVKRRKGFLEGPVRLKKEKSKNSKMNSENQENEVDGSAHD